MTLSVRTRFEVFKRDSFTCRYCGRAIEDEGVKLEVDHITPKAAGGSDDPTNLITSCWDCNHGKADKSLGDRMPSLTEAMINTRERALQLDEYRQWQASLDDVNNRLLVRVWQEWIDMFGGRKEPHPEKEGHTAWYCELVGLPSKSVLYRHFGDLEVAQILEAIHTTYRKWVAGGLYDGDVLRYFYGCLKHKVADLHQPEPDQCDGTCAYTDGREMGVWHENQRIRNLFINHTAEGFATYADVVAALWPDD